MSPFDSMNIGKDGRIIQDGSVLPRVGLLNTDELAEGTTNLYYRKFYPFYRQVGVAPIERWYPAGGLTGASGGGLSFTIDTIRVLPLILPSGGTLDRLGIEITTLAAGGTGRLGIYDSVSITDLTPNNLIVDGGAVVTTAVAVVSVTINQILTAGKLYWLAVNLGTLAPSLRTVNAGTVSGILGYPNTLGTSVGLGWQVASAFGALPNPFPASPTVMITPVPLIAYRLSA
jgi:hypothetical protein